MVDIATLGIAVRSDQVDQANRSLERFSQVSGSAERAAKGVGSEASKAGRMAQVANDNAAGSAARAAAAYGRWEVVARRVGTAVGAIAGALATGALIQYADAWSDMQSRVGAAVRDMEAAPELMQRMVDIANASYSPLDQTVEVYSRNVAVLRDLGRGATEAADFTEALNHALVLTATRGERAASVQNALSKAMAVGRLQADGLETVLANGGEVAQVLADQLGTTVSGLRQMATDGKITGDVIATAMISRLEDLRDRAGEMPATVGDAFVRLRTNLTAFIGQLDQSTGSSERLAGAIMWVADNIDTLARVAAIAGVALLTAFAPAILAAMGAGLTALGAAGVAAMRAITVAVMANPLGALAVAITTAITAVYLFRDEIKNAIGVDVVAIVQQAMNTVIGALVGAYDAAMATWRQLPAALGDLGFQAAQKFLDGIVWMAREAVSIINGLISSINGSLRGVGLDSLQIPDLGAPVKTVPSARLNNPYAGSAAGVGNAASEAFSAAMARDYVGATKEAVEATRTATDAISDMNSALEEVGGAGGSGGAGGGASGSAAKAAEGLKQVEDAAESAKQSLGQGFGGILKGLIDGTLSWKDALMQAGQVALKYINQILSANGGGGLFGGGFLSGLFGSLLGFSRGGYTGNGPQGAAAGIVHGQEYVFSAAATRRLGVGYLDQLHRAANGGGPVAAPRMHAPANQPVRIITEVRVDSHFNADGGFETAVGNVATPIAQKESTASRRRSAQAVPSMVDARHDERDVRRIRPRGVA